MSTKAPIQALKLITSKANEAPFQYPVDPSRRQVHYIKTNAPEKFSVYEMKDGKPTSSPTTSGKGRTSSRRSWTADTWNWARSGWNSRARDHRHDGQRVYAPHRAASRANVAPQPGATKRCLAKEPQDLRLSGCGIARDCGGALQFVRQEYAWTKGQRERAAPATDLAGQHDSNAGDEEPAQAERQKWQRQRPRLRWRSSAAATPSSGPPPRPMDQPALPCPAFRASPARKRSRATCRCNSRPGNSKHS